MKTIPRKALRLLINEAQQTMQEQPDATVTLVVRGTYQADKDGDLVIGASAAPSPIIHQVPVSAEAGATYTRRWDDIGNGEFVLRIQRQGQ